jgi:hypothetical protein
MEALNSDVLIVSTVGSDQSDNQGLLEMGRSDGIAVDLSVIEIFPMAL